jgi:hypothetical protein
VSHATKHDSGDGPDWPCRDDHNAKESQSCKWQVRARQRFLRRCRRLFAEMLLAHGTARVDDVHDRVPVPDGVSPKICGQIPQDFAREGIIAPADYPATHRTIAHRRRITVWRLLDADAARRWLTTHPGCATTIRPARP